MQLDDLVAYLASGLATISAAAAAATWKKADAATPRSEFQEFAKDTRATMHKLFENAEEDRKVMRGALEKAAEDRTEIREQIHSNHVSLLTAIHEK